MEALFTIVGIIIGGAIAHFSGVAARKEERANSAVSRAGAISPDAYALRRQLVSWNREWPRNPDSDTAQRWAKSISTQFDIAERRASSIAAAAGDLSTDRAVAARRAFILFYELTDLLNSAAEGEFWVWSSKSEPVRMEARSGAAYAVNAAKTVIQRCIAELEQSVDHELVEIAELVGRHVQEITDKEAPKDSLPR